MAAVIGLSNEVRQKLERIRPATLGQAARIEGVTAAALTLVLAHVKGAPKAPKVPDSCFGPEDFAATTGVSRETLARLKAYADVLADWNARHNLVSKGTWQIFGGGISGIPPNLAPLIPNQARTLADLGSGAGFPGLVLAEMLPRANRRDPYEATAKKCDFLRGRGRADGLASCQHRKCRGWRTEAPAIRCRSPPGPVRPCPYCSIMHSISRDRTVFAYF